MSTVSVEDRQTAGGTKNGITVQLEEKERIFLIAQLTEEGRSILERIRQNGRKPDSPITLPLTWSEVTLLFTITGDKHEEGNEEPNNTLLGKILAQIQTEPVQS